MYILSCLAMAFVLALYMFLMKRVAARRKARLRLLRAQLNKIQGRDIER